jgi:surface antigen
MTSGRNTPLRGFFIPLLVALATASPPAMALNWVPLLKNSPAERFDDEDLHLFLNTARKAVSEASDNQTMSWENPNTKHRGDFTILKTFRKDGRACKQVQTRTEADGRKATSVVDACQVDGKWRLIGAPQRK